jgi:hypothetical protein
MSSNTASTSIQTDIKSFEHNNTEFSPLPTTTLKQKWESLNSFAQTLSTDSHLKTSDKDLMERMGTYANNRQRESRKAAKLAFHAKLKTLDGDQEGILKELEATNKKLIGMLENLTYKDVKDFPNLFKTESEQLQSKISAFAETRKSLANTLEDRVARLKEKILAHDQIKQQQIDAKLVAHYLKKDSLVTEDVVVAAIKKKTDKIALNTTELKNIESTDAKFDASYKQMNEVHKTNQILGQVAPNMVFLNELITKFDKISSNFEVSIKNCKKDAYDTLVENCVTPAELQLDKIKTMKTEIEKKVLIAVKSLNGENVSAVSSQASSPVTPTKTIVVDEEVEGFVVPKNPIESKKIVERKAETSNEKNIELLTTKFAELSIKIDGFTQTLNNMKVKSQLYPHLDYYAKNLMETRDSLRSTRLTSKTKTNFDVGYKQSKPVIDTIYKDVGAKTESTPSVKELYVRVLEQSKKPFFNDPDVNVTSLKTELEKMRNPFNATVIDSAIQKHKVQKETIQKSLYDTVTNKWKDCSDLATSSNFELDVRIYILTHFPKEPENNFPNVKAWCYDKTPYETTFYTLHAVPNHTEGVEKLVNPFTI